MYCWSHSTVRLVRLEPPMPAKMRGTNVGGMPPRIESCSICCSTLRCSRRSISWRVLSSSCRRFSSSVLAKSQVRI